MSQEVQEGEKEKKDEEKEKEKKKEAEPNFQLLENPARVMPAQLKVLNMPETCRYQPFKPVITHFYLLSICVCVWCVQVKFIQEILAKNYYIYTHNNI